MLNRVAISDRWLTARRLRAHGLLLALSLWSVYIWILATPGLRDRNGNLKGTDFLHLYTLGTLAAEHRGADLYNMEVQSSLAWQRAPAATGVRYLPLYPPQVSMLFAPLAHLSYGWALALWLGCTVLIYAVCCYSVWRVCPNLQGDGLVVAVLASGFPAFFHLIAWGQTTALALACFTAGFLLLRRETGFAAGLVLGCLIFKPQLGVAAVLVFIATGAWTMVAGAFLSAGVQIAAGMAYYGAEPYRAWLGVMWHVPAYLASFEPRPYQTHCLRTFWAMLVPWGPLSLTLYILSALLVLGWTIRIWRSRQPLAMRYSALLLATVLVSPHLTVYDLAILAPAFLLMADHLISAPGLMEGMGTILYLIYILPLLVPLTRWTHVQLSVIAMTLLMYWIWRVADARAEVNGMAHVETASLNG